MVIRVKTDFLGVLGVYSYSNLSILRKFLAGEPQQTSSFLLHYSRVSNKRVGWNKHAGWKIPPNFGNFGDIKLFEMHLSKF